MTSKRLYIASHRACPPFGAETFVGAGARRQTFALISARRRLLTAIDHLRAKSSLRAISILVSSITNAEKSGLRKWMEHRDCEHPHPEAMISFVSFLF